MPTHEPGATAVVGQLDNKISAGLFVVGQAEVETTDSLQTKTKVAVNSRIFVSGHSKKSQCLKSEI